MELEKEREKERKKQLDIERQKDEQKRKEIEDQNQKKLKKIQDDIQTQEHIAILVTLTQLQRRNEEKLERMRIQKENIAKEVTEVREEEKKTQNKINELAESVRRLETSWAVKVEEFAPVITIKAKESENEPEQEHLSKPDSPKQDKGLPEVEQTQQ
ncbi:MAG: hypothetical protein EZS28_026942 [Streblomastix strix]|uniref:Uncharacterized protein n=1 Tax=Streblomastix strix TaxID=222440 RepID=A0A5J4V4R0_9EUKA|nr:MAG: hypothetical protein EZS28_026942 [Streblomastix strix]